MTRSQPVSYSVFDKLLESIFSNFKSIVPIVGGKTGLTNFECSCKKRYFAVLGDIVVRNLDL